MKRKTIIRNSNDMELYERCIQTAIKLSEQDVYYSGQINYNYQVVPTKTPKYNTDEIFKLADKLFNRIKAAK